MNSDLDQVWRRFAEGGRTRDYFDALYRWAAGRSPLAAFVIGLEPFPAVTEAIRRVQLPLRNVPGIDFVPPHLMRVGVLTVGFVGKRTGAEEVSHPDLAGLSDRAGAVFANTSPISLRLGAVNSLSDRVFVEVEDDGVLARLREALASSLPPDLQPPLESGPSPRVDIAYYTGERPSRDVASVLSPFREVDPQRIEVGAVDLVTTPLIRARRFVPPTLVRRYHLGKEAP